MTITNMPGHNLDFVWLPLSNTVSFGGMLISNDWVYSEDLEVPSETDNDHLEALVRLRDIHSVRIGMWGVPNGDVVNRAVGYLNEVADEIHRYSNSHFLAETAYYIGATLQFLLTVQMNPIHQVDGILRIGKVETQAKLLVKVLSALRAHYEKTYPEWIGSSSMLKYLKHIIPVVERMSTSDIFNPLNKECVMLERLRGLSESKVSIHGSEKGWIVKGPNGKKLSENVDGAIAIMDAITTLQFGTEDL